MARHSIDSFPALAPAKRRLPHPDDSRRHVEVSFGDPQALPVAEVTSQFDIDHPTDLSQDTRSRFEAIAAGLDKTGYMPQVGNLFEAITPKEKERFSWLQTVRGKLGAIALGVKRFVSSLEVSYSEPKRQLLTDAQWEADMEAARQAGREKAKTRLGRTANQKATHTENGSLIVDSTIEGPGHFELAPPYEDIATAEQQVYASLEARSQANETPSWLPKDAAQAQNLYLFTHWGETPTSAYLADNFKGKPSVYDPKHPHSHHHDMPSTAA